MTSFKFQDRITSEKKWYYGLVLLPFLIVIIAFFTWGNLSMPVTISCNDATLGAEIYVDGKLKGSFDTDIVEFRVLRGRHQFAVRKDGFRDTTFDTSITNEVYLHVELNPILDSISLSTSN
jgi:hypothetical protein